jgi:hypothetical protein
VRSIIKVKIKTVGVARQQLHFLYRDKENDAKESFALRWHVFFVRSATSIQVVLIDQESALTPQDPRLLRPSPFVEGCNGRHAFRLFPCKSHRKGGPPATGRLIKLRSYWMSQKSGKGDALRKEKGTFAYFCCRTKVWRLAGRDPPV